MMYGGLVAVEQSDKQSFAVEPDQQDTNHQHYLLARKFFVEFGKSGVAFADYVAQCKWVRNYFRHYKNNQ